MPTHRIAYDEYGRQVLIPIAPEPVATPAPTGRRIAGLQAETRRNPRATMPGTSFRPEDAPPVFDAPEIVVRNPLDERDADTGDYLIPRDESLTAEQIEQGERAMTQSKPGATPPPPREAAKAARMATAEQAMQREQQARAERTEQARARQDRVAAEGARYAAVLRAETEAIRRRAAGNAAAGTGVESGILPGEEQVTTRSTFDRLAPGQRAAIQQQWSKGAGDDNFDEYLTRTFGDLPPAERAEEMARVAGPAGLTQQQRQDRRDVTQNFLLPDIPMMEGKGTFVRNPDGSRSMRAIDPHGLDAAKMFSADQLWQPEFNRVLGRAMGINVDHPRYRNNEDKLRDDVLRLWAEHERVAGVSKVEDTGAKQAGMFAAPNITGNRRYVVDKDKAAEVQANRDAAMRPEDRRRLADSIIQRWSGADFFTPDVRAQIEQAEQTDNGFAILRGINQELTRQHNAATAAAVKSRRANENLTTDLNNPRSNRGMVIRSLLDEANRNNPMAMAVLHDAAGMPDQAREMRQLAAMQQQGNIQMALQAQQLAAANPTLAGQFAAQRSAIFEQAKTPAERLALMKDVLSRQQTREGAPPPDDKAITSQARRLIAEHMVRINPQDTSVQEYLQDLSNSGNRNDFITFLTSPPMNMSIGDAENRWAQSRGWGIGGFVAGGEARINAAGRFFGNLFGGSQQAGR